MLFHRKTFTETIKAMTPYEGILYFRDAAEKGTFEVCCLKKTKFFSDMVLLRVVFETEDASIFSGDVGVVREPFYANINDVLAALAGKEPFAKYEDGMFDGVAVGGKRGVSLEDDTDYKTSRFRETMKYHEGQNKSALTFTIPAGQHRIITRYIKDFPSVDQTRHSMNTVCIHFSHKDCIRVVGTDGRSMAVYQLPGEFNEALSGTWTISPEMFFAPPHVYESVTFAFSKEAVVMSIRGRPGDPIITAYDVALEWRDLQELRYELKTAFLAGEKDQEEVDEAVKLRIDEGPKRIFPNYERVIPQDNTETIVLDRAEINLGLEKLKRSLYEARWEKKKVFIIDALDPKNIFLTSMTSVNDYGIDYIDTKLPLKKAEVSQTIRVGIIKDCFDKCCLEGGDRIEFKIRDAKRAFLVEGADFFKGHSVEVIKLFMPFSFPDTFSSNGVAPEKPDPDPREQVSEEFGD
jgi:hypothetical protein